MGIRGGSDLEDLLEDILGPRGLAELRETQERTFRARHKARIRAWRWGVRERDEALRAARGTLSPMTPAEFTVAAEQLKAEIKADWATLTDGVWNKKDISALVSLVGGVAGILALGHTTATALGWL